MILIVKLFDTADFPHNKIKEIDMITFEEFFFPCFITEFYLDGKRIGGLRGVVERLAMKYANRKDVPIQLLRHLTDESYWVKPRLPAETHKIVRMDNCETSEGGFLQTHWKKHCSDRVVFDGRYLITLYESREYESGHYQCSSVRITSCVEVIDLVDNRQATKKSVIPDTFGSDRFNAHLGNRIETVRVIGKKVCLETSFGAQSNQIILCLG